MKVVTTHKGDILRTHVQFEVLEEGVGVFGSERDENAQTSRECSVHQTLRTAWNQGGFLERCHHLANVEVAHHLEKDQVCKPSV